MTWTRFRRLARREDVVLSSFVSVAEWLACWNQTQKAWVLIAVAALSGNGLRQTVRGNRASVR